MWVWIDGNLHFLYAFLSGLSLVKHDPCLTPSLQRFVSLNLLVSENIFVSDARGPSALNWLSKSFKCHSADLYNGSKLFEDVGQGSLQLFHTNLQEWRSDAVRGQTKESPSRVAGGNGKATTTFSFKLFT
jgi:hypothetical protein